MSGYANRGRQLALRALRGEAMERVPVALFTWGFDYQGTGTGEHPPTLLEEDKERWIILDNNTGLCRGLNKQSLALYELDSGRKECDPVGVIESADDAERLIPMFGGWGRAYLEELRRLIDAVGERALVLPHHSPAYICACYAFGFERAMKIMLTDPALFKHVCDRFQAGDALRMKEWAEAGAAAVFIADGWASCDIISPDMFERFALPYQRSITDAARAAGLKIILWNEGDIRPLLSLEAAIPVDAFAFEQPRKGVALSVADVRKAFGSNRCLFGNLDSESLFLRASPAVIEEAVREQIRQSGARAPFILSTGSPLPSNADPEAVDMMIAAANSGSADT